jgi:hypothetical protein
VLVVKVKPVLQTTVFITCIQQIILEKTIGKHPSLSESTHNTNRDTVLSRCIKNFKAVLKLIQYCIKRSGKMQEAAHAGEI